MTEEPPIIRLDDYAPDGATTVLTIDKEFYEPISGTIPRLDQIYYRCYDNWLRCRRIGRHRRAKYWGRRFFLLQHKIWGTKLPPRNRIKIDVNINTQTIIILHR